MSVDLTQFERGEPFAGEYDADLRMTQDRLAALQVRQIVHGRRAMIVIDGWAGAGKKSALRGLSAVLDPCHFSCHCGIETAADARERHWLSRFWARLPGAGDTAAFHHSWHQQLTDRILAVGDNDKSVVRAFDEINEFENQQHEHGTAIVKLFFHLPANVQAERLRTRQEDEWRRWTVTDTDLRSLHTRPAAQAAWQQVFAATDTRWAPWTIIDAGNEKAAHLAALSAIAAQLGKAMPAHPPVGEVKVAALAPLVG